MGFSSGGSGGGSIAGGSDVTLSNPGQNQTLVYNNTTSKWENVSLTKSIVGLANIDNTADSAKPVSTAQASAIAAKTSVVVGGTAQSTLTIDTTPVTPASLGAEPAGLSAATLAAIDARIQSAIDAASVGGGSSTPSAPVLGSTVVQDGFSGADGAVVAAEGGQAYTMLSGSWRVSGQKLAQSTTSGSSIIVNAGIVNYDVRAQIIYQGPAATNIVGLIGSVADVDNKLGFYSDAGVLKIVKWDTAVKTVLATGPSTPTTDGSAAYYRLTVKNNVVYGYIDDVQKVTYTLTTDEVTKYKSNTKVGFVMNGYGAALFDNFTVKQVS